MEYSAFVFVTVLMLIDQPVSTKNDLKIWYDFLNHSKTNFTGNFTRTRKALKSLKQNVAGIWTRILGFAQEFHVQTQC